jgi:hypothetical protein
MAGTLGRERATSTATILILISRPAAVMGGRPATAIRMIAPRRGKRNDRCPTSTRARMRSRCSGSTRRDRRYAGAGTPPEPRRGRAAGHSSRLPRSPRPVGSPDPPACSDAERSVRKLRPCSSRAVVVPQQSAQPLTATHLGVPERAGLADDQLVAEPLMVPLCLLFTPSASSPLTFGRPDR